MKTNLKRSLFGLKHYCPKDSACIVRILRYSFILIFLVILVTPGEGQNIGIGTNTPSQKLDVNGNVKLGDNLMVEGNQTTMKVYRNLASYATHVGTPGAFVIHTNQPLSGLQWSITVEGYIYSTPRFFRIFISGYINSPDYAGCVYEGTDKLPVRMGYEGSNLVVVVGDTNTMYMYPQIVVTEYLQCYSSLIESYADGWTITRASNLSAFTGMILVPDKSYLQWTDSGSNIYRSSGNIGIGTNNPGYKLDISGGDVRLTDSAPWLNLNATGSTENSGFHFLTSNASRAFIYYNNQYKYLKISNSSAGESNELVIDSTGCAAINPDVMGDITERFSVFGSVKGGIRGFTANSSKFGVYGINTATNNYGTLGSNMYGVDGHLGYSIGGNYGVHGEGPGVFTSAGSDYTPIASLGGVKGTVGYGSYYTFGVAGFMSFDASRAGGCFGGRNTGGTWGCLGYLTSGWVMYGGYFTSSSSGSGYLAGGKPTYESHGIGAYGDLFGADIHGEIYGTFTEGSHYGLYSRGDIYRTGLDIHLQGSPDHQDILYTNVSTDVTVQTSGIARLTSGQCTVTFDQKFREVISDDFPVIVTVTPIGESAGLNLASLTADGFIVRENNSGRSMVEFTYIAIGRRKGFENPDPAKEVVSSDYLNKLSEGMHNDNDKLTDGKRLLFHDGQLTVDSKSSK